MAFFHLMMTRSDAKLGRWLRRLQDQAPNLTNLLATGLIFVVVIYFQGWRVDLPVKYQKHKGQQGTYPSSCSYVEHAYHLTGRWSATCISSSQMLHNRYPDVFLIGLIGKWGKKEGYGEATVPVGGIAYYISPPRSMMEVIYDPVHAVFYIIFILASCAVFSTM